jgi:hypothetical protein
MKNRLITHIKFNNHFCGVEHTNADNEEILYCSLLKKSKQEINISKTIEVKTIKGLSQELPKNQHVALIINNHQVLSKSIDSEQKDLLKLVHKAFPNINSNEFYIEAIQEDNRYFLSICRKDYVQNLIEQYATQKIWVIDIALGNNAIKTISSLVKNDSFYTSNSKLEKYQNQIMSIEKELDLNKKLYDVNGLEISNQNLLAFSGALKIFLKEDKTLINYSDLKKELTDNFFHKRIFNLTLKTGGLFILGLLLVNFIFFNHYFNKSNELSALSEINQTKKNQILTLSEIVLKKQKLIDDLSKNNSSKSSHFINTIVMNLPETILLSQFNYQPLLKSIKADNQIDLKENTIEITGLSIDSEALSIWINHLEQINCIDKIDIIEYSFQTANSSSFTIAIKIINDK